jgi:hypothetical protein
VAVVVTAVATVALVAVGLVSVGTGVDAAPAEPLRMNHFQAKGSHNSYHIEQPPEVLDEYFAIAPQLEPWLLAYTHPPLAEHLDLGFRQFELDLFADRDGDFFEPVGTPGFKTLHIDVIDESSQCPLFTDCLRDLETWSDANPDHMPIAVLLEMKEGILTATGPTTPDDLLALDAEIRTVFDPDQIVTPDFVRGVGRPGGADGQGTVYPDVESAILDEGWPYLEDTRGKFVFLLDNERTDYVNGDPTLAGRVAFPPSSPGSPDAAFLKMNNPEGANLAEIQTRVAQGYMVRTRGDLPVETGLTGDDSQLQAALASGAHWVSGDYLTPTDYERYDAAFAQRFNLAFDPARPAYQTVIPGGDPARCNPITAPIGCQASDVEPGAIEPPPQPPATEPDEPTTEEEPGSAVAVPGADAAGTVRPSTAPARIISDTAPSFTG